MSLEMFMGGEPAAAVVWQPHMMICIKCKTPKPATTEYFHAALDRRDNLKCTCKECACQYGRERYQNLTEEEKRAENKRTRANKKLKPHRAAFTSKRSNVKRDGTYKWHLGAAGTPEAEAFIEHWKTVIHCPDCGKELECLSDKRAKSSSLDRIDSNGDYTKENVRVICDVCNTRKSSSPVDEWVGLLEVRIRKGIIPKVDPRLTEFLICE